MSLRHASARQRRSRAAGALTSTVCHPPLARSPLLDTLPQPTGNLTYALADLDGTVYSRSVGPGFALVAPIGHTHTLGNEGCEEATLVNFFTATNFTRVVLGPTLASLGVAVGPDFIDTTLGVPSITAAPLFAPLQANDCPKRCSLE